MNLFTVIFNWFASISNWFLHLDLTFGFTVSEFIFGVLCITFLYNIILKFFNKK